MTVTPLHPDDSPDDTATEPSLEPSPESVRPNMFDDTPIADLTDDVLRDRVLGYSGQLAALTARWLDLLVELDTRHAWSGDGVLSCAHWLSWQAGLSPRTAQEHLRVAHALTDLPLLHEAFAAGRLTYSKVRALTRVATPEREQELLNVAASATAAQVERLVRAMRQVDRNTTEHEQGHIESRGRWRWNLDGSLSVNLRLSALDGARFLAGAVRAEYDRTRTAGDDDLPAEVFDPPVDPEAAVAALPEEGPEMDTWQRDLWRHVPADIAPAVIAMADTLHTAVDIPEIAPGAEILIHTHAADDDADAAATTDPDDTTDDNPEPDDATEPDDTECAESSQGLLSPDPHLDDGPALADVEVDEARCGAAVRKVRTAGRGAVLKWGHKRRTPTASLVRAIFQRDRGCAHPGCGRTRHLHIHHVAFWSRGGRTEPDNLIMLCGTHHRALHRGEFGIKALGGQRFSFHRPSGTVIETAPPTSTPDGWTPDPAIAEDATMSVAGGRLDLGYTTEVLYAIWQLKARQQSEAEEAEPVAA